MFKKKQQQHHHPHQKNHQHHQKLNQLLLPPTPNENSDSNNVPTVPSKRARFNSMRPSSPISQPYSTPSHLPLIAPTPKRADSESINQLIKSLTRMMILDDHQPT